jgi:hypothetical protein
MLVLVQGDILNFDQNTRDTCLIEKACRSIDFSSKQHHLDACQVMQKLNVVSRIISSIIGSMEYLD